MLTATLSSGELRRIKELLGHFGGEADERREALIEASKLIPMGSMYVKVPAMKDLISDCNILEAILELEKDKRNLSDVEIVFLSDIVNKLMISTEEVRDFKSAEVVRRYYHLLIDLSRRAGIAEATSNAFFARGVYYITCIDKSYGAEHLYNIVQEEERAGRLFNAGHAALDWLFCIDQSKTLTTEELMLIVGLITKLCKRAVHVLESQLTTGFAKGLLWLTSNFKYFFMNGLSSNPLWLDLIQDSELITTETLAGFAKLLRVGLTYTMRTSDHDYYTKFYEMGKNTINLLYNIVAVSSPADVFRILSKTYLHLAREDPAAELEGSNAPEKLRLTRIHELKITSSENTLSGWLELSSSKPKLFFRYLEGFSGLLTKEDEYEEPLRMIVQAGLFCTQYLHPYYKIGTIVLEAVSSSKYMKYFGKICEPYGIKL